MKKKNLLLACSLLGVITFSSCEKNLYDESKQPEKEIKMTDLDIPSDFEWNLTQVAKGTTKANVQTMVSLYLDEKCSESEKVASVPVYTDALNLPLSLPTYANTLYAKYKNNQGKDVIESVPIIADSYSLDIDDAAEATQVPSSRATTRGNDIEDDIKFQGGVVYHPKNGWGTIMFEDQFPILGDYDFNDFVVNYKAQFDVCKSKSKDKDYESKSMVIGLRLKAVGGIYKYIPKLRLKEIERENVESIEMSYNNNNKIEANLSEDEEGNLIIDCSSLIKNLDKRGSQFYNTEQGALVATNDLPEITIVIELKKAEEVDDILEDDEFDLYLENTEDGTEIHMNGIEPVKYVYPANNENLYPIYKSNGKIEDDNYYFSKKKLIWGLRVPGNASHAIEKANFLKAYPNFAKWAQSGGKNASNWYGQGNANKDLLIYN